MREFRRLLGHLRPYAGRMVLAALLLGLSGALMAAVVSTVKPLVNEVLLRQAPAPGGARWLAAPTRGLGEWAAAHAPLAVPLWLVLLFLVRGVCLYFGQYLTVRCGALVIRDLRSALYDAIVRQSMVFFQLHPTGTILSRVMHDVQQLQRLTTTQLADAVRVGAMVPFLLAVTLIHDWRMSLAALVALPLLGYPMVRLGRRLRRASTSSQEQMAQVADRLAESVAGIRIIQAFGMEAHEAGRFRRALDGMLRADLRAARAGALAPAVMELAGAIVGAALFYLAGRFIASGRLDAGDLAVVVVCLGLLFMSIRRLNAVYAELQRAFAAAVRVFDVLDGERRVVDRPGAVALPRASGRVDFAGVAFDYGDEAVLRGIDLSIEPGESVAIVGPSGSGKTTLVHLIPRFHDPTAGAVCIDGRDLRDVTLASLREQIGLVTQETILFDESVRDNIACGRIDVPFERIVEAARAARAHGFIEALPEGYATRLGERGSRLSMGQRQRVAIARALLKDPPLLILDEATSALDAESESQVQQALEALTRGRTSIVIAHRLSTARRADRIVVLQAGRIVELGSHDHLISAGGLYARLHGLQFREDGA